MKVHEFHNETFEVTLELIIFSSRNKKDCDSLVKRGIELDIDKTLTEQVVHSAKGFCSNIRKAKKGQTILMCFDSIAFDDSIDKLTTLQHECSHFEQSILEEIGAVIDRVDLESHLRISDWAFKKCMSVKFFKSLLK